MENYASRGRGRGPGAGRGRGRHQSENPRQNPYAWQSVGQSENPRQNPYAWQSSDQYRESIDAGGVGYSGQRGGANYRPQRPNRPQDRWPIEGIDAQSGNTGGNQYGGPQRPNRPQDGWPIEGIDARSGNAGGNQYGGPQRPSWRQEYRPIEGSEVQFGDFSGARYGGQRGGATYRPQRPYWPQDRLPIEGTGAQSSEVGGQRRRTTSGPQSSNWSQDRWQTGGSGAHSSHPRGRAGPLSGRGSMGQQVARNLGFDRQSSSSVAIGGEHFGSTRQLGSSSTVAIAGEHSGSTGLLASSSTAAIVGEHFGSTGQLGSSSTVAIVGEHLDSTGQLGSSSTEAVANVAIPSLKLQSTMISTSLSGTTKIIPIKRPDKGGRAQIRSLRILVNHFRVKFDYQLPIHHYDLDIQPVTTPKRSANVKIPKPELLLIKNQLFVDYPTEFPESKICYDGQKNLYSAAELLEGKYLVTVSRGEDVRPREYTVSVKQVKVLDSLRLIDYLNGKEMLKPRDVLQAMDVIMGENPRRTRIPIGPYFYNKRVDQELGEGIIASVGFDQSLKTTAQGLSLCIDYTAMSFRKQLPVLDFLRANLCIKIDPGTSWDERQKMDVNNVLKGLKVTVNHRRTSQKYVVGSLTRYDTRNLTFDIDSPDGMGSKRTVGILEYFREKYDKTVVYQGLPCLELSKSKGINYVPMEFCEIVQGQRYPKELLSKGAAKALKEMALIKPQLRKQWICSMVGAGDGPCGGEITDQFNFSVSKEMSIVTGRVLQQPDLKICDGNGQQCCFTPLKDGQWNLVQKKVFSGMQIDGWGILDFTASNRDWRRLNVDQFVRGITSRANRIGIRMNWNFLCYRPSRMSVLDNEKQLYRELKKVYDDTKGKLQLLFCPMDGHHPGYNALKRICETDIGILTQCFLSDRANENKDQYYVNLALKFNAKLGGSNMELFQRLPGLGDDCHVMFMGADVNHPSSKSLSSKSIAAVTASMNWPGANRYAARIRAQPRRTEKILQIGDMCSSLIEAYARCNGVRPQKIIFFRDGVSEGQFEMVLNEELVDIKKAIESDSYRPTITLVVAQKRHQTRLFPQDPNEGGRSGNIPPGTVVDTVIVSPQDYDFFLSSHYGNLGTSKPTHYHCLWDEHNFNSDTLQRIIYNLCYIFPRCTKPVSLVTPVFCADLAAYRGRQYDDSNMHSSPSTTTSSSRSVSLSSSLASLDVSDFPTVHPDLENQMIYC